MMTEYLFNQLTPAPAGLALHQGAARRWPQPTPPKDCDEASFYPSPGFGKAMAAFLAPSRQFTIADLAAP
jgi:hypothetical protein